MKKAGDKGVFDLFITEIKAARAKMVGSVLESDESGKLAEGLSELINKTVDYANNKTK